LNEEAYANVTLGEEF